MLRLKCSDCCPHPTNCPKTNSCKLKIAVDHRVLSSTPDFLIVQLLRFKNFTNIKTDTIVIPEENLTLPDGDRFRLVGIGDHLGYLIENGHYAASVQIGHKWPRCNDEKTAKASNVISSNNYIFVYSKIPEDRKFVSTFDWKEIYNGQPFPPGLHVEIDIKTGKRYAKRINQHTNSVNAKPTAEQRPKHVDLCSVCNVSVDDLDKHLESHSVGSMTQTQDSKNENVNKNINLKGKNK